MSENRQVKVHFLGKERQKCETFACQRNGNMESGTGAEQDS